MLRYYFNIEPDTLNEDDWAMRVTELEWILPKINGSDNKK